MNWNRHVLEGVESHRHLAQVTGLPGGLQLIRGVGGRCIVEVIDASCRGACHVPAVSAHIHRLHTQQLSVQVSAVCAHIHHLNTQKLSVIKNPHVFYIFSSLHIYSQTLAQHEASAHQPTKVASMGRRIYLFERRPLTLLAELCAAM